MSCCSSGGTLLQNITKYNDSYNIQSNNVWSRSGSIKVVFSNLLDTCTIYSESDYLFSQTDIYIAKEHL